MDPQILMLAGTLILQIATIFRQSRCTHIEICDCIKLDRDVMEPEA